MTTKHLASLDHPALEILAPSRVIEISFLRAKIIRYDLELAHRQALINSNHYEHLSENSNCERLFNVQNKTELRINIHHEYISYQWYLSSVDTISDLDEFLASLPDKWLSNFPGEILTKSLLSIEPFQHSQTVSAIVCDLFSGSQILTGLLERNCARVWTDFRTSNTHGFTQIYIEDLGLGPKRAGRACQTILDIENYRKLVVLSAPIAEEIIFKLENKEQHLARLIEKVSFLQEPNKQQALLAELFELSSQSERWRNRTGHRFSATEAYKRILFDRLADFEPVPDMGYQSIHHFLSAKLLPTYRTCMAADKRLQIFISRIDRAISLLSAKIRLRSESQNNQLLSKLENQNKQQTILQETIETFAIVAISYNMVALLQIFLQSLHSKGVIMDLDYWLLVAVPCCLLISYLMIRYIKHRKMSRMRQLERQQHAK